MSNIYFATSYMIAQIWQLGSKWLGDKSIYITVPINSIKDALKVHCLAPSIYHCLNRQSIPMVQKKISQSIPSGPEKINRLPDHFRKKFIYCVSTHLCFSSSKHILFFLYPVYRWQPFLFYGTHRFFIWRHSWYSKFLTTGLS